MCGRQEEWTSGDKWISKCGHVPGLTRTSRISRHFHLLCSRLKDISMAIECNYATNSFRTSLGSQGSQALTLINFSLGLFMSYSQRFLYRLAALKSWSLPVTQALLPLAKLSRRGTGLEQTLDWTWETTEVVSHLFYGLKTSWCPQVYFSSLSVSNIYPY